jgi:hypothetical protein
LRVAARARDVAGVIDRVAGRERRDRGTDRFHDTGRVVAEHFRLRLDLRLGRADFGIDRIDRNGFDAHEQVVRAGNRFRQFDVDQRLRIVDRQVAGQGNGFHHGILVAGHASCTCICVRNAHFTVRTTGATLRIVQARRRRNPRDGQVPRRDHLAQ